MDDLVEIPTLKFQLFGRATPFQYCSETRNIIEDGNTTTLPCRDIKKPNQSKESQKGIQLAILSKPITTKIKWSIEGWEGLTLVSCEKSKGKWSTEGWEEVRQQVWDNLRRMVDHPTLLGQKENGLPKVGEKHL
ncbi:hypothetical protein H5410_036145 [Solanum commersonii]|uniref:Uncharacterized protein n=1 Tax=Solanum commersonii TaxID=4109 RepID=A0A9J5Y3B6_SOLCO|nr:hypothetical protein H5410_036145 [Solanum commersonii]